MKTILASVALIFVATSLSWAGSKIRWPRDVVEWDKLEDAKETAAEEEKGFAFIFVPGEWDDKDPGVANSIDATNDAIRALKSFCLIVKGDMGAVRQGANQGKVPKALVDGIGKAGNSYPLVVVLDGEMTTFLGATSGKDIATEGSKVFREAKKKFRELKKANEEK